MINLFKNEEDIYNQVFHSLSIFVSEIVSIYSSL